MVLDQKEVTEHFKIFVNSNKTVKLVSNNAKTLIKKNITPVFELGPAFLKTPYICPASHTRFSETYVEKIIEAILQKLCNKEIVAEVPFGKVFSYEKVEEIVLFLKQELGILSRTREIESTKSIFSVLEKIPV